MDADTAHLLATYATLIFVVVNCFTWIAFFENHKIIASLSKYVNWTIYAVFYHAALIFIVWGFSQ